MAGLGAEILSQDLPNTNQESEPLDGDVKSLAKSVASLKQFPLRAFSAKFQY
jgi:hypothetical protein